jgi:hypothetical protein
LWRKGFTGCGSLQDARKSNTIVYTVAGILHRDLKRETQGVAPMLTACVPYQ